MGQVVHDCPRCGAKSTTLDAYAVNPLPRDYDWQVTWETFVTCRNCRRSSILILKLESGADHTLDAVKNPVGSQAGLNQVYRIAGYIGLKDQAAADPPEYVPKAIADSFREGATCIAVQCWNAAGAMFRLCVDLATRSQLPPEGNPERPPHKTCRDLGKL